VIRAHDALLMLSGGTGGLPTRGVASLLTRATKRAECDRGEGEKTFFSASHRVPNLGLCTGRAAVLCCPDAASASAPLSAQPPAATAPCPTSSLPGSGGKGLGPAAAPAAYEADSGALGGRLVGVQA